MRRNHLQVICFLFICCTSLMACNSESQVEANIVADKIEANMVSVVAVSQNEEADPTEKQSILLKLKENNHLPVEERVALFYRLKKENPNAYDFDNEEDLNLYGYSLLWDNKIGDAVEIFKLVVAEFPNSSNAYDSLGEAYLANGDKELSVTNYEKSLSLDPENFNAEDQIEYINHPNRKISPVEKRTKVYSVEEYRLDLDALGRRLKEVNPNTLKFISDNEFNQLIADKKALISPMTTFGEFSWHCSEIIASINCSHTSMGGFYFENSMLPIANRFPVQVRWVDEKLFVINPLNNGSKVNVKDEILSINQMPVADVMAEIYKHIPSQGYVETTKKNDFNTWSTVMIPFALDFPSTFEIELKGQSNSIVLDGPDVSIDPMGDPSIERCGELCLDYIDDKTAIMTVASFNYYRWNNYADFEAFADKSFAELKEKKIENLVLDMRFNGGGSPESSIYLLKYLMHTPFTYFADTDYPEGKGVQTPIADNFDGKLFFIIDGNGSSTTGHFMATVKYYEIGTIVGEELGSNQFCTGGQKICRVPNTKLEFYVGMSTSRLAIDSLPDETGVLPDYFVTQSIDDYLNEVDAVENYTLNLIKNN